MDRQRDRGGQTQGQTQGQTGRPHAGPKTHGQTKRQRGTETDRQTSCRTQGTWTDKRERGGQKQRDRYRDRDGQTDLMQDPRHMDRQKKRGGQKQRDRYRDRYRQTDLMQDPRQRASQFQTLVDVEDQVGFIVQTMLSLVVTVPEEQLVHLGQTSHILDPIN